MLEISCNSPSIYLYLIGILGLVFCVGIFGPWVLFGPNHESDEMKGKYSHSLSFGEEHKCCVCVCELRASRRREAKVEEISQGLWESKVSSMV